MADKKVIIDGHEATYVVEASTLPPAVQDDDGIAKTHIVIDDKEALIVDTETE